MGHMSRNTSITLGEKYSKFVNEQIEAGRFQSTSEAVRAGLSLLEEHEMKLDLIRETLALGETQLDQGKGTDGEQFMNELIG